MTQTFDGGFDIEPSGGAPAGQSIVPPAVMLTSDKVRSVRFYEAKPGYEFRQVETFVDQVIETLAFLEGALFRAQAEAHEKAEEVAELQGVVTNLRMTIEIFRAKGDPVVGPDGSYVTESQLAATSEVETLRSQISEAHAQLQALADERELLVQQLLAAQQHAEQGWAAEAALRSYIDDELAPWLAAQQASQPEAQPEESSRDAELAAAVVEPVVEPAAVDDVSVQAPHGNEHVEEYIPAVEAAPASEMPADVISEPSDGESDAEPSVAVQDDAEFYARFTAAVEAIDAGQDPEPILRGDVPVELPAQAETATQPSAGSEDRVDDALPAEPVPALEPAAEVEPEPAPVAHVAVPADAAAAMAALGTPPPAGPRRSLLALSPEAQAAGADVAAPIYDETPAVAPAPRRDLLASSPEAQAAARSAEQE